MPDQPPTWPARTLAVVVSTGNHILAVRHKTARQGDKRLAMWSDPSQTADVVRSMGAAWRVIVSHRASPVTLYDFLASVTAEQVRGYILDPLEPLQTNYDLLAIPMLEDWRQFEPSALPADRETLADLHPWNAIVESYVRDCEDTVQTYVQRWDALVSSVLEHGLQEWPTALPPLDLAPPTRPTRSTPTVTRRTVIRLKSQPDNDQVKIGPDSPVRKEEPDHERADRRYCSDSPLRKEPPKPPDPDPTKLIEI